MAAILIVDDSATDRRLARGLLRGQGPWELYEAADGEEALERIEDHVPDLILTDLQMPDMDGLELVSVVRERYPLIPVVLMTSKGSEEIAVRALHEGAASYVSKKRLSQDLVEAVKRVLNASGEGRSQSRLMNRVSKLESVFVLENDLSLFPPLVNYLQQSAAMVRFGRDIDRLRMGVAFDEALVNACFHGNLEVGSELREVDHNAYYELARQRLNEPQYANRRIFVKLCITRDEITCVVRDEGPGFDPTQLPDPTDPANIEKPSGRGLLLMQTFMDEVRFNEKGNEVTLIKRNPQSQPDQETEVA